MRADLVVLAHGGTGRGVLSLELLARHPLTRVVGRGQRSLGGVGRRVLTLLTGELVVWSILLPAVAWLGKGERNTVRIEVNCIYSKK